MVCLGPRLVDLGWLCRPLESVSTPKLQIASPVAFISSDSCCLSSFPLQGDSGLIPRICEGLFSQISETTRWDEASFRTEVR